ncbi:MAG: pentapeptide repeat-containing protein [Terrisporobacter sp.]|uniref:pentapeptide repeat-containing protein n=1 Tax=Terrisporobacter sp. TaxID=1965305 RepID=UPI002FC8656D
MAYVNFKEEIYKLKIQLDKRKKNNENTYKYIIKHKEDMTDYYPDNKYSYNNIQDEIIGKKGVLNEVDFYNISNKDILCSEFHDCTFSNVKFINCRIIGCKFYNCKFKEGGVIFENCIFIMEDSVKSPSLNNEANYSCEFYSCEFYSDFRNCDLSYAIFEKCLIRNTYFEISMMKSIILNNCELNNIKISDCDLSGFKTFKCYIIDLEFDDKYKTKMDEKTFFDKLIEIKKDRDEHEDLYQTYQIIADKYKDNTLNNNFGEYYYLCKKMESKTLDPIPKICSYLNRMSCGYGERPFNALYLGIFLIIIFAFIYLIVGVDIDSKYVVYNLSTIKDFNLMRFIGDYNEALALSSGVFLGVGGFSCEPVKVSLLVSSMEMVMGTVTVGIGVGAIVRKIIR